MPGDSHQRSEFLAHFTDRLKLRESLCSRRASLCVEFQQRSVQLKENRDTLIYSKLEYPDAYEIHELLEKQGRLLRHQLRPELEPIVESIERCNGEIWNLDQHISNCRVDATDKGVSFEEVDKLLDAHNARVRAITADAKQQIEAAAVLATEPPDDGKAPAESIAPSVTEASPQPAGEVPAENLAPTLPEATSPDSTRVQETTTLAVGEASADLAEANGGSVQPSEHKCFSHSDDYCSIRFDGQDFALTPNQALIVQVLHEAHEQGLPGVTNEALLVRIGTPKSRLRDSFRRGDGPHLWRKLVVKIPGRKNFYRLNLPLSEEKP